MATQIVTPSDLEQFKQELLEEIQSIVESYHQPKPWLRTADVRQMLGISQGKLQSLRRNGSLPYMQIGNVFYYAYRDVDQMMRKNRRTRKTPIPYGR